MEIVSAAILGIIQGLTEFLPISSTAHLRIVPHLLGQPDVRLAIAEVRAEADVDAMHVRA